MASVKVAVRVRPLNKRELDMESRFIIEMDGTRTSIANMKVLQHSQGDTSRERMKHFQFDYSYWTVNKTDPTFASQQQVFRDLGQDVVNNAYDGYNACVFAYGQTGSGKTYTMMGTAGDSGLTPRICQELFARMKGEFVTYRTEVSYLEIYNEKVRDLLRRTPKAEHTLRVREHPKEGPYVQDLSKHLVQNYDDIKELLDRGNSIRTTASTNMNDTSSRSHAIFTLVFTQAKFSKNTPSEMRSKVHLVDLAGSERADASGATGQRLKEGGSINKSLVTLGNVISALADLSEKGRRNIFIPYRDSVLTWLLKDSLGGNSKTIMIATISPAECNYGETLSTLRYANRAKNIINKPMVNEDPNVKIIRELRAEISRLQTLLGGNIDKIATPRVQEKLHENEARIKVLTEEWTGRWKEMAHILKEETLALRKEGIGVVLDSELPHLIGIDDDILRTGIVLYHLKEGVTSIGTADAEHKQDIELLGLEIEPEHCIIQHVSGETTLIPTEDSLCTVNGNVIYEPTKLSQGSVILLGRTNMFRFNHPAQAAKLREHPEFKATVGLSRGSLLSQSMSELCRSTDNLTLMTSGWEMEQKHQDQLAALEVKRKQIEEMEEVFRKSEVEREGEQVERERELENKRHLLEKMQVEAEQAQRRAKQEADNLRRRSLDLEERAKQLEAQQLEHSRQQETIDEEQRSPVGERRSPSEGRRSPLEEQVSQELSSLLEEERLLREQAETDRQQLLQELSSLESQWHQERAALQSERQRCQERQKELDKKRTELEEDHSKQTQALQEQGEKEMDLLQKERAHLEALQQDHKRFGEFMGELSTASQQRLLGESDRLTQAQLDIIEREKHLYNLYKLEEKCILDKKENTQNEIEERRKQLEADKIYLHECHEVFEASSRTMSGASDADRARLEKEKLALKEETLRVEHEEKTLDKMESSQKIETAAALKQLQVKRSGQIDELNAEKQSLKDMQDQWVVLVSELSEQCQKQLASRESGEELSRAESELLTERNKLETERSEMAESERRLVERDQRRNSDCEGAKEAVQARLDEISGHLRQQLGSIQHRKQLLSELSPTEPSSEELEQKQRGLERYMQLKEAGLLDESQKLVEDQSVTSSNTSSSPTRAQSIIRQILFQQEWGQLHNRMQELKSLEDQLQEKHQAFEAQRQQELDKIDYERLKLQEMEHQEHISGLVEQEVRRRLFEQRVARQKQRSAEREREAAEREVELSKIKKAHDKELQRLKRRYETNNHHIENTPTRANPYASVMSGDVTPGGMSRTSSRKNRMERTQSLYSLSSTGASTTLQVTVPSFVQRGSGFDTHFVYEVKIFMGPDEWSVFRRYSRFRDMHQELKAKYREVAALVFPPKRFLGNWSEKVAAERRELLQDYLQNMINVLQRHPECTFHHSRSHLYSKQLLIEFHPFFKKGVFEAGRHSTG